MNAIQPNQHKEPPQNMSHRVIEALATADNSDPLSMSPPLYDAVDPDALDLLLDTDAPVEVEFEYDEYTVVADSEGRVTVDGDVFFTAEGA